jgi:RNA polymerase sigma-70 factor (ECF subfamily)
MAETREAIEERIRDAHALGDHERAAALAVETYGREVLGFLITRLGEQSGNDVFSDFLEDFWRGLPGFAWRSTLRSWVYTLARHAAARHLRGSSRRQERLATDAGISAVVERVRTETAAHLRTEVKDRFRELRAQLPEDDQTLLILRIDRKLSWRELALVMAEPDAAPRDDELDMAAARLRQRFQSAKERLRELAKAEGLLPERDEEA